MTATRWKLGNRTAAIGGPMVTIWEYDPTEPPDTAGHRPSDRLIGSIRVPDAERAVAAVNAQADQERIAMSPDVELVAGTTAQAPEGVWVTYYWDYSSFAVFPTELDALRYAMPSHMAVTRLPYGVCLRDHTTAAHRDPRHAP